MTNESIRLPYESEASADYILRQEIPALQLLGTEAGLARWGPMIRLPRGAQVYEFGKGFDEHTLLVRFNNSFYIIFSQDLAESQRSLKQRREAQTA